MKTTRRRLIKALTLSGGAITAARLPSQWTSPVVDSVVLPAHAQTTQTPLSGSTEMFVGDAGAGSRFRSFARRPILDRLIPAAHANIDPPLPTDQRAFAFAERDFALGDGWWRVQVLLRADFSESQTKNTPRPPFVDTFIREAHAGIEVPSSCTAEVLFETRLQVGENGSSGWGSDISPSDSCGDIGIPGPETIDMRLTQFDNPDSATTGRVQIGDDNTALATIVITPGGAPLFVDCGPNACELED